MRYTLKICAISRACSVSSSGSPGGANGKCPDIGVQFRTAPSVQTRVESIAPLSRAPHRNIGDQAQHRRTALNNQPLGFFHRFFETHGVGFIRFAGERPTAFLGSFAVLPFEDRRRWKLAQVL